MAAHPPPSSPPPFVPSASTRDWLYSLPLPPGCTTQPEPQTPDDWALVEQYRLLVSGLVVLGEYERERQRREQRGEDPFATAWDPRTCSNPVVLAAVDSLVKDASLDSDPASARTSSSHPVAASTPETDAAYLGALSAVQAALGGSAAGVLRPRASSPSTATTASSRAPHHAHPHHRPQPRSASSSSGSAAATAFHDDYSTSATSSIAGAPSFRLDPATGDMIASLPLSLSDLASLPSHAALNGGPGGTGLDLAHLDPAQIHPDGILADHLPLDLSGPASLPSLMGAIAELEQCVARLSLEANEARTLQKTLRMEMAARTGGAGAGAGAGGGAGGGAAPGAARAAAKKKKRKAKKRAAAEASAAAAAAAAASSGSPHEHEHEYEREHEHDHDHEHEHEHDEHDDELDDEHLHAPLTRDEALVSGLSGRADDCCSECGESHASAPPPPPPQHAPASVIAGSAHRAVGVGAWEDGELMKALQSVSQLDRRADEYRERLRVLKEQIHHHAALADSLAAAPPSTNGHGVGARGAFVQGRLAGEGVAEGLWPVDAEGEGEGDMYELDEEEEEEEMSDEADE